MKFNWKQILPAFLIGCLLGGVAGAWCQKSAFHRFWTHGPYADRLLKKFTRGLSLDAKQQAAVKVILEKERGKMKELREETSNQFKKIRADMRSEIKKILTPEQQGKFEEMMARWDARHKKFRSRKGI